MLNSVQDANNVDLPVLLSVEICGLAESWSRGNTWFHISTRTTLEQGDLHRVFKRTADILRQISVLQPHVLSDPTLIDKARRALHQFGRFPVTEAVIDLTSDETETNLYPSSNNNSTVGDVKDGLKREMTYHSTERFNHVPLFFFEEDYDDRDVIIGASMTAEQLERKMRRFVLEAPSIEGNRRKANKLRKMF
jgi:hypothetical protein